jgi:predicted RNA-binding protein with PUA domain
MEYLIRWKNYDPSDDTWEPEPNLSGAQELLKAYKREQGL